MQIKRRIQTSSFPLLPSMIGILFLAATVGTFLSLAAPVPSPETSPPPVATQQSRTERFYPSEPVVAATTPEPVVAPPDIESPSTPTVSQTTPLPNNSSPSSETQPGIVNSLLQPVVNIADTLLGGLIRSK